MKDRLQRNMDFARDLYERDPAAFKDLTVQVKALEPTILNFMKAAMKAPADIPLDVTTVEELEVLAIDLDNIGSRLRDLIRNSKGSMGVAIVLETLKAASRHIQDAADDLLELHAAQGGP